MNENRTRAPSSQSDRRAAVRADEAVVALTLKRFVAVFAGNKAGEPIQVSVASRTNSFGDDDLRPDT